MNQAFAGLQAKHGDWRVMDTSIRECTIIGQGIGAALRGLRPMVEIQYLDYLLYGIQLLSDDLATLTYRTKGGQKAPLIVRTRGHRLEGVWHSGSPMGMILSSLRGMIVCVPRNMTQAAGMYATLLQSDEPALVIECLNGYRLKEQLPQNMGEYTVPGGGTAYMMQQVLDHQGVYAYLDAAPQTLAAQAHRPAYSTDGDYFSKPSVEDVVEKVYQIMHESNPKKFPAL